MRIAFFGDLVLHETTSCKIGNNLRKLLDTCDIKTLNFEGPISAKIQSPIIKSGPYVKQDVKAPEWVIENGFNLVSMANNHIFDLGQDAFIETYQAFKNLSVVGVGTLTEAYAPQVFVCDNIKVGFLAATHKEFGCHDESDTSDTIGAAWVSSQELINAIINYSSKVDKLFLISHAGIEYMDIPLPEWRYKYRKLIDLGLAGIIASHPHCPQGIEYYKNCPIIYSLGNFIFQKESTAQYTRYWNNGLIAVVNITDAGISTELLPVKYDVVTNIVDLDNSSDAAQHLDYINRMLNNQDEYNAVLSDALKKLVPHYTWMYESLGFYKPKFKWNFCKKLIKQMLGKSPNSMDAYNLFNCESHKWVMQRLIQSKLI